MPRKTSKTQHSNARRLAFQPTTYKGVQRGINKLANAIRPTLGPQPRVVAIDRILDSRMPELLDNGGDIAKRTIQLPGWHEDVGAMLLRDVLTRLSDQVGDGTATAAVLFQSVYNEGVRYITSGGNAMRLRIALEKGMEVIIEQLTEMTVFMKGEENLTRIAETVCQDAALAEVMGEVFDIIGEYGRLEIRGSNGRGIEREYSEGMYWERGLVSRKMITDTERARTDFENANILISDLKITQPQQLYPALELALRAKIPHLIIVADQLSDSAIGFLLANKNPEKFQAVAIGTPGVGPEGKAAAITDMALLTGGRPFRRATGETFERLQVSDFGHARRAWADQRNFGVIGGKGNPRELRQHIATLRATYNNSDDIVLRGQLLKRIGMLLGGSATIWVGGVTEYQLEERVEIAKRTAATMRGAMMEGVVPGGGVALLACRSALQAKLDESTDTDERAAYRILQDTLAEPFRTIVTNAGYDDRDIMAQIRLAGHNHAFDVTSGQVIRVDKSHIYDTAHMQKSAIYAGIASAALALTIDVLVHRNGEETLQSIKGPGKRKRL